MYRYLCVLILGASKRYRQQWQQTIDRVEQTNDSVAASMRRIEVMENGGKPSRLLKFTA
jgi:hypothetical protein